MNNPTTSLGVFALGYENQLVEIDATIALRILVRTLTNPETLFWLTFVF